MAKPLISLIVPNYMGRDIFPACINSLLRQDYPNLQIILCDDSSTDGSLALAKELYGRNKKVTLAQTPRNSGYVGACNHALQFCRGKYVMVTNNDATFPKNWVSEMYHSVEGKTKTIGASVLLSSKSDRLMLGHIAKGSYAAWTLAGFGGAWRVLTPEEKQSGLMEVHAHGVLIFPRNAVKDYIFEKDYFAYGEDIELCWRLRLRGYHVVANKRAHMYHLGSFTRKKVASFNKRAIYHGSKNTIVNFLIFYDLKNVLRIAPMFLAIQLGLLLARPREWPYRLKSYWWVLTHMPTILQRRRLHQHERVVNDADIIRLMSYKIDDEESAPAGFRRIVVRCANILARIYLRIVCLKTFDRDNPHAAPAVDKQAVALRRAKSI